MNPVSDVLVDSVHCSHWLKAKRYWLLLPIWCVTTEMLSMLGLIKKSWWVSMCFCHHSCFGILLILNSWIRFLFLENLWMFLQNIFLVFFNSYLFDSCFLTIFKIVFWWLVIISLWNCLLRKWFWFKLLLHNRFWYLSFYFVF